MRLAISIWNDRIPPVFDAAGRSLLVGIEEGQEHERQVEVLSDTLPSRRIGRLTELRVKPSFVGESPGLSSHYSPISGYRFALGRLARWMVC
jgi:hypothetical protein